MTFQGLYRLKPASQAVVAPVARWLVRRGIAPDLVTWAAVPVALVGGICLALSATAPLLLLVVPVAAALRLGLNLLDGMVARESGATHPLGELWNELGDRLADTLFIGGLAFHPQVDPRLASGAVIAAMVASYVGVTARAAGGRRQYGGLMSKPGRMATLGATAPITLITGDPWWLVLGAWVILLGGIATALARIAAARRDLD
jgi:phosphatidylglycerophosphate synthase